MTKLFVYTCAFVFYVKMTSVGSKTPVSILNEYFTATTGRMPSYDLITNTLLPNPFFTYRVTADDYFAEGSGSSKQVAKHNAAQQLLDIIKQDPSSHCDLNRVMPSLSSPQENQLSFNAVGTLMEYCSTKNHPIPVYTIVREEGPAHAKTFTCQCSVSNVSEMGTARTKKQAKHQAANATLTKLKTLFGEEVNPVAIKTDRVVPPVKADDHINEKYFNLTKSQRTAGGDTSFLVNQYRAYCRYLDRSATLVKLASGEQWDAQPLQTLMAIAEEIGVEPNLKTVEGKTTKQSFVYLPISPGLSRSANTLDEAAKLAVDAMLSFLM